MEPLNDDDLNKLLDQWEAPARPRSLRQKVFAGKPSIWRRLWTGSLRVPIPVAIGAALLIVFWLQYSNNSSSAPVSLAGFEPVRRLDPISYSGGPR
jgi:hypothetical protein